MRRRKSLSFQMLTVHGLTNCTPSFIFNADTGEKPYQCGLCGMNFRQKDGLKRHENAKHTNKPATPYPCDVCGKILQTKYSLKFHMGKHTTKRESLKCDLCDKILYTEKALKAHKRWVQWQRRPYAEHLYGFLFDSIFISRNHGGDVEFKCTTCDFQTPSKPALYTHQIMEHQIYPWVATSKRTIFKLFDHYNHFIFVRRSEEIIFTCAECGEEFDNLASLGACSCRWYDTYYEKINLEFNQFNFSCRGALKEGRTQLQSTRKWIRFRQLSSYFEPYVSQSD